MLCCCEYVDPCFEGDTALLRKDRDISVADAIEALANSNPAANAIEISFFMLASPRSTLPRR
jgi:hypothetical protein